MGGVRLRETQQSMKERDYRLIFLQWVDGERRLFGFSELDFETKCLMKRC